MKRILKNRLFIVIITLMIGISGTLYATTKYQASEILFNPSSGDSMTVNEALNELYNNNKNNQCSTLCGTVTVEAEVGDYVQMNPTSTSYTISKDLTGYTSDQTINPSELNLWRIIKINDDGTVEMVSEYVSSTNVIFSGETGYLNFVGTLNEIASQYGNSKYVVGSRIMGYNGQTEYLTSSFSKLWSTTSDNSKETVGGGDIMYRDDTNLVTEVLGTLVANNLSGTATSYWLGSRVYYLGSSTWYVYWWANRSIISDGSLDSKFMVGLTTGSKWESSSSACAIRPILTLKSGLTVTGKGTKTSPLILE